MLEDLTVFAMAGRAMSWLNRRQEVLAQNVANADTPEYKPKDLKPVDFKDLLAPQKQPVTAAVTDPRHIQPPVDASEFTAYTEQRPEESKINGNQVLLEEQMQKIGDGKDNFQLAANIAAANISMLKMAIGSNNG